jgi:hypothetical protein
MGVFGGGSGGGAPDPPDYSKISDSSEKAADLEFDYGTQQFDFYKDQYDEYKPYVTDYLQSMTDTSEENRTRANEYYDTYTETYLPIEKEFAQTALDYANPGRIEQRAAQAGADVANQYEASRNTALQSLESYGIDPSQTRYGALDLSSRTFQAAATAAAMTKSRENTEKAGREFQDDAIKTGRGYASDTSNAYKVATDTGASGIKSANDLYSTSSTALGTPNSYFSNSSNSLKNWGDMLNTGYQNETTGYAAEQKASSDTWGGIGKLAGAALPFLLR